LTTEGLDKQLMLFYLFTGHHVLSLSSVAGSEDNTNEQIPGDINAPLEE